MRKYKKSPGSLLNEEHTQDKEEEEGPKESWLDLITAGKFTAWIEAPGEETPSPKGVCACFLCNLRNAPLG